MGVGVEMGGRREKGKEVGEDPQAPGKHSWNFPLIRLRADRNIRAPSSLSDVLLSAGCRLQWQKKKKKKKNTRERERNEAEKKCWPRVQQLKVHYADCGVRMPPFRETNFSFTVTLSAWMIRNGLERSGGVKAIRLE